MSPAPVTSAISSEPKIGMCTVGAPGSNSAMPRLPRVMSTACIRVRSRIVAAGPLEHRAGCRRCGRRAPAPLPTRSACRRSGRGSRAAGSASRPAPGSARPLLPQRLRDLATRAPASPGPSRSRRAAPRRRAAHAASAARSNAGARVGVDRRGRRRDRCARPAAWRSGCRRRGCAS